MGFTFKKSLAESFIFYSVAVWGLEVGAVAIYRWITEPVKCDVVKNLM